MTLPPLRIALVNPPSPPAFRVSRGLMGGFGMAVGEALMYPPIELAHVASVLEAEGHEVILLDCDAYELDGPGALERIVAGSPQLVCFDSSSASLEHDLELARSVRSKLGIPVAILGSQVSFAPDEVFANRSLDAVVRGEPEYTVRELAERVAKNPSEPDLAGVAGLTWCDATGEIHAEPEREKIRDLDELPLPARHLLENHLYTFPGVDEAITTVKSSRGCPLNCSFCGYTLAQGLRFRFRSPAHVLAELVDLVRVHNVKHVVFRDPIFSTRRDRVIEICDGILAEGLEIEWQCETAVKVLDAELLAKMAAAGCRHVSLGVESGNVEIQKKHCGAKLVKNEEIHLEQAMEVFDACRELGIETRAFCMIGFPEETPAMVLETLELVEKLDPDQVQFCAVTAYPGTPLYQMLKGTREFDWATMTGFQALEGNEHMTAAEIEEQIRMAYRRFYGRPKRLVRELKHPGRLARRVARYFRLFRQRA